MKYLVSEAREAYEDMYHGVFSKKLAEHAIDSMTDKNGEKIVKKSFEDVRKLIRDLGVKIEPKYEYTAWYLFNMATADCPHVIKTDEQKVWFAYDTIYDPDGCPEAVLECYTAKQCAIGEPIFWEDML